MRLTKSDIFWKSWWWSAACGAGVAVLFLIVTSVPIFDWFFKLVSFVDVLVILSIAGCYLGAGYVGSRIAAKYYTDHEGRYMKRYVKFSVISFVLLVALEFSPLSFLAVLWSFVAPYCVLLTLNGLPTKHAEPAHRTTRRSRKKLA